MWSCSSYAEQFLKVQCSECHLYWNQGVVYCTCGYFFKESESSWSFHLWRLNAFSIKNLRHHEGATSWCSARQNWGTGRAFHSPFCTEEMSQKLIWINSRSLPTTFNTSWSTTQNWMDWGEVHRDGQISTGKTPIAQRLRSFQFFKKIGISHWTNQAETPIRLPNSTCKYAPFPPWIWRRACRTFSFSTISKMVPFFLKWFMVELGHVQKMVELISLTVDGNLLQPTGGGENSTLDTSLFLMQWTRTHCCTSHCMVQECVGARHAIDMVTHVCELMSCSLFVLHLVPFRVFLLSLLLLPEPLLPCRRHRDNIPLALRQLRNLVFWLINTPLAWETSVNGERGEESPEGRGGLRQRARIWGRDWPRCARCRTGWRGWNAPCHLEGELSSLTGSEWAWWNGAWWFRAVKDEVGGQKEGDPIWTLTHQDIQNENFDVFFEFVVARSCTTVDSNLLQPTVCVKRTPFTRHIFSCFTVHISMSHVIGWRFLSASCHPCFKRSGCFDSLRHSILHSSPSLSSSFSSSWSSSSSSFSMWVGSGRSAMCFPRMRS